MSYRRMLISVGFFVFLTAVLLIVGLGYVISQKGIFEKKNHFNLVAKSGADLIEGMPVLYSGFEIGMVTKLQLTKEGRVEVQIEIPNQQLRWIRESSIFNLNKPLIGSAAIVVKSPNLEDAQLSVQVERELVTIDGINELIGKVQPVLDDLQGILSNVNKLTDAKADLAKILKHVERITYKVSQTEAVNKLDLIMDNINTMIAKADRGILGDDNSSLSKVNAMLDDIAMKLKKLDTTVDAVNQSSGKIDGITKDIKFSMKKTDEILNGVSGIIGSKPEGEVTLP